MRLGLSLAVVLVAGSLGAFAGLQFTQPSGGGAGFSPGLVTTSNISNDESVNEGLELIESLGAYGWKSFMQSVDRVFHSLNGPQSEPATKGV
jgi:hypothetical protein